MIKNIFFDLDGTVIDSGKGIMNALRYAYQKEHLVVPEDSVLKKFIGPTLLESFQKYSKIDAHSQLAQRLVTDFQEFYKTDGWKQMTLYPQIITLLQKLAHKGLQSYIVTAKPEQFALKIVQYLQIEQYFQGIYGADLSETMAKSEIVAQALQAHQLQTDETIMIGDRETDVNGAQANQVATIGVLYGFGNAEELTNAGAIAVIEQPLDLLDKLGSRSNEEIL